MVVAFQNRKRLLVGCPKDLLIQVVFKYSCLGKKEGKDGTTCAEHKVS